MASVTWLVHMAFRITARFICRAAWRNSVENGQLDAIFMHLYVLQVESQAREL